jgi:hypothetical protein
MKWTGFVVQTGDIRMRGNNLTEDVKGRNYLDLCAKMLG